MAAVDPRPAPAGAKAPSYLSDTPRLQGLLAALEAAISLTAREPAGFFRDYRLSELRDSRDMTVNLLARVQLQPRAARLIREARDARHTWVSMARVARKAGALELMKTYLARARGFSRAVRRHKRMALDEVRS
jgi:hypothetical protein